ncbi:LytR/AlgR family response regulator transcription factor [Emticicia sp. SJ17W-69]|uniref:LytR/AlgR family response regulator transcription factor n=1 Tax=Emticicia sp. SJ17W-69 TaxID=3421657 RepID=UPI003EBA9E8E
MRCIAVDDEPLALDLLEDNIRQIPYLEFVGRCRNAFEAIDLIQTEKAENRSIDLIFLDIQMPGITGVQFLKSMVSNPMVIFITAYEQYALEGFELNIVDYLLKPVSFERFLKAVNKANELHQLKSNTYSTKNVFDEHFFVNAEYSLVKIRYADILYIEGLKDYIKIYLSTQSRPVITRMTMKSIEEKFSSMPFMRIHKSYIVSLNKIESIRNLKITIGTHLIPVSEQFSEDLMRRIGGK